MFSYPIINYLIICVLLIGIILFLYGRLRNARGLPKAVSIDTEKYTIESMIDYIRTTLNEMINSNLYDLGLTEEEFRRRSNQRMELKRALKGCSTGDRSDKTYVKAMIADLLVQTYGLDEHSIDLPIPFKTRSQLSIQDKFEMILHVYQKKYQDAAIHYWIQDYHLDQPKTVIEEGETESYIITVEEVDEIFRSMTWNLTFEDKLSIIVQRIYAHYKGFGVIDAIRDMQIDGVSGGVSGGSRPDNQSQHSIWLFYQGKSIHLSFLAFHSEMELKRICQIIHKYNNPGQLSETNGYIINELKDGSRVVVVRPPFSESWAFFVRKFDIPNISLERLLPDENAMLPIRLLQFLMKGARITAVTGAQGSGKTTLLMAMIKYIYATYTLRVQEMAFEIHARDLYPERNILTFRETASISGQEGLDVQKKTDGTVHILGEVATDPVAAWMIQMSQVASLFTVFTHHAKTFRDLIFSLRNSLLKTGVFNHEMVAEQQVVQVINFDVHLTKDETGKRYIERITECVPVRSEPHAMHAEPQFEARNIVEFRDGRYVAAHRISDKNIQEMHRFMTMRDQEAFAAYLAEHWGDKSLCGS